MTRSCLIVFLLNCLQLNNLHGQLPQIAVPRIERMSNMPAPYNLRNWQQVARQYDSFVYNVNKSGQYLPLISIGASGVNYPQNKTIKLHTYVGTNSPSGSEAINVLPSLVGASLVGIDKSNQFGQNWLSLSQDFFNKGNGENIYLNNAGSSSGSDAWYDVMPNVFFYQLYDLYPTINSEANYQFTTIADRFLEAVRAMGGRDTAWAVPNMNYRAWKFKTMQPLLTGVKEPEMAGGYAWILYNAYKKTGNKEYLKGSEWAMEFLDNYPTNPSYELQLPYGTYTAAKMNAELGTTYDVQKMLNWSFDRGGVRGWGTIVGTWGGFDVSGLVGEANDGGNDYAFQLNGVQQAAALVPMVRYDKRFARAIGKWVLNLANATRLFYPRYLPDSRQDAAVWSNTYDPNQVIGYEALREKWQGLSPFSTGDALGGGWGATNLALYGTGSIGYLGSMIEETNVEKIIKIDVLKTDFFDGKNAINNSTVYPTYLFFNPYLISKTIEFNVGNNNSDIYDALSETFIARNVSGITNLIIPANQAILMTITPVNGAITYNRNKMLVNNRIVDYKQSLNTYTKSVRIKALAATKKTIEFNDSTLIYATAIDPDGGLINYKWSTNKGVIKGTDKTINWIAPNTEGGAKVQVIATDSKGNSDTASIDLTVVSRINAAPVISTIQKSVNYIATNGTVQFTALATDPNNDPLTYLWTANGGTFSNATTRQTTWTAPNTEGVSTINLSVTDNGNLSATASTTVLIKNFNATPANLIAYYPFTGNTNDLTVNHLDGIASGIAFVPDRFNMADRAAYFNGGTQHVKVNNSPILNVTNAISVSCWFNPARLGDKEVFLLSHGSWQNRWKLSVTPEKNVRWTVNTLNSVADLDASGAFSIDSFYHITATYDGALMAIYVNGQLKSYKPLTGNIRTTTLPFLIGQMLIDNADYNFKGIIDEVKLFDYALSPVAAASLYQQSITSLKDFAPPQYKTLKVSPNPVFNTLSIHFPFELINGNSINNSDLINNSNSVNSKTIVQILNTNGQLVGEEEVQPNAGFKPASGLGLAIELNVSHLLSGIYVVLIKTNNVIATARFIKL
jgi:hypothetical protein